MRNRALRSFALGQQFVALRERQMVEVVHQRAAGLVNLAAFFFFDLERLPGGDDEDGRGVQGRSCDALGFLQIQHGDRSRLAQGDVVGM